jgi:hypothetical protein
VVLMGPKCYIEASHTVRFRWRNECHLIGLFIVKHEASRDGVACCIAYRVRWDGLLGCRAFTFGVTVTVELKDMEKPSGSNYNMLRGNNSIRSPFWSASTLYACCTVEITGPL